MLHAVCKVRLPLFRTTAKDDGRSLCVIQSISKPKHRTIIEIFHWKIFSYVTMKRIYSLSRVCMTRR